MSALDFAKYFMKRGLDTEKNTYDGNMKLQKLLFFADLICLSEKGRLLFSDPVSAFSNGCVVENVRLRYKNDYDELFKESCCFESNFTQDEYDVLKLTTDIFGGLSAKELSDLSHSFNFWKVAYERSKSASGFKDKRMAEITVDEMMSELDKIKAVIDSYRDNEVNRAFKEVVNGVKFYYDPAIDMTDDVFEQLESFAANAEDKAYSVYLDNGELVIY